MTRGPLPKLKMETPHHPVTDEEFPFDFSSPFFEAPRLDGQYHALSSQANVETGLKLIELNFASQVPRLNQTVSQHQKYSMVLGL